MSDDGFFREVNEELRSDRVKQIWTRYGIYIIALVVAVVAGTALYRGYEYWTFRQASSSGDRFLAALNLAEEGRTEEAMEALDALEDDGYAAYRVLARMRAATLQAETGDVNAAISAFSAIGNDASVTPALRDIARLRAAYLMVDHAGYEEVARQVEPISDDDDPMRHSAREALGLAAWKAGDVQRAGQWFEQIAEDPAAPRNLVGRANVMLELIAGSAAGAEAKDASES